MGIDRSTGISNTPPELLKKLRDYQRTGVLWLRSKKAALLGDDMGLGKTNQALCALPYKARTVVVCPASVVLVWEEEIKKWRGDLRPTSGEPLRRPHEGEVLIISYDSLPDSPFPFSGKLVAEPMGDVHLILDECHMVKSNSARRTAKVRGLRRQCGTVWGLTGTPMPGSPEDLWGVLLSLGLEGTFKDLVEFIAMCGGRKKYITKKDRHGIPRLKDVGYEWGVVSPEVKARLEAGAMLRRKQSDVLKELPPAQFVDIPVPAPLDLTEFLDEVKEAWDGVGPSDLPPFELLAEARAALARSRIPAAVAAVRDLAETMPILVFSAHVDPILAVGELPGAEFFCGPTALKDRKKAIDKFKSGKARILAMTIDSGGVGLNLQEAGGVFFVDRDYTPGLNDQAIARAKRMGQRNSCVMIWRMISQHPLDLRLNQILDEKTRLISEIVG